MASSLRDSILAVENTYWISDKGQRSQVKRIFIKRLLLQIKRAILASNSNSDKLCLYVLSFIFA